MTLGVATPTRWNALTIGLQVAGPGWALEFGVHRGHSLRMIAAARPGMVAGFDSFQGLPEDWVGAWTRGTFALDHIPAIPGAEIVPGWFADTVAPWLEAHNGPVALVHIDCDLYSSTATVLGALRDRLEPGAVLVFDEFHGYPEADQHEARAWAESGIHGDVTLVGDHQAVAVVR